MEYYIVCMDAKGNQPAIFEEEVRAIEILGGLLGMEGSPRWDRGGNYSVEFLGKELAQEFVEAFREFEVYPRRVYIIPTGKWEEREAARLDKTLRAFEKERGKE